jgi:hypothetical protein
MKVSETELLNACLEAMQEFVDRVDRGEVRSKYTYDKFSKILVRAKKERYCVRVSN